MCLSITIIVVGNIPITTCNRSITSGSRIYIDFYKINRPCLCTVSALFDGVLLATAEELAISSCYTQVKVNGSHRFGCPISRGSSATFTLESYQSLDVQAEYSTSSSPGTFYQCLGFQQNGKIFFLNYFEEIEERNIFKVIELFYTHCLYYDEKKPLKKMINHK